MRTQLIRTLLGVSVAAVTTLGFAGCSGMTQTGNPYTLKIDREVRAFVAADLRTAHTTVRVMLEDEFLFLVTHDALDAREGIIEAKTAKERFVRVETYAVGDAQTAVEIFVGPLGDYRAEVDILSQLERRLPPAVTAATARER